MNCDPTSPTLTRRLRLLMAGIRTAHGPIRTVRRRACHFSPAARCRRPRYFGRSATRRTGLKTAGVMNVLHRISSHTRLAGTAPTTSPQGCTPLNW